MLKKLSFVLIAAILLTACGASAPMETEADAVRSEETLPVSVSTDTMEECAESYPGYGTTPETPAATEPAASEAEYFSFTKYSNEITNEDGLTLLTENRCTPNFTSADEQRSQWVNEVLEGIERDYKTDSTNLYTYAQEFVNADGTEYFYSYSNYQQMGVARHDEAVVSLIALSSLYSGGTHPNSVQVAYNLDITNQRLLRLEDVIEEKAAPELARMVRQSVDETFAFIDGGNGLFADYGDTIAGSMIYGNMTPYWYLNDNGLVVFYNQYELGPYAAGIIKAELGYEDLEGILLEEYFPAEPSGIPGDLVLRGEWEGYRRIPITLDQEEGVLLVGVEGTVYQVRLSEVLWLEDTPIAQNMRFSAMSLGQNDVLEICGGYTDETKSFVLEFIDGSGAHHIYHIRDGELSSDP